MNTGMDLEEIYKGSNSIANITCIESMNQFLYVVVVIRLHSFHAILFATPIGQQIVNLQICRRY